MTDGERDDEPGGQDVATFVVGANPHHYLTARQRDDDVVGALATALRTAVQRGVTVEHARKILNEAITEAAGEPRT
jgi:hypothetical protein